jgi:acetyl esterase
MSPAPVSHPDVQKVLDARGEFNLPSLSVEAARAGHLAGSTAGPKGPDMDSVEDVHIADVPVRVLRPPEATGGALVFFHGGGWVLGSVETHDRQCRQLAAASGATVFNVDYRLAPEHRFPAAYDDALAVTQHVLEAGEAFGIDPTRVAVGGDSAGGNLAAATAIGLRRSDTPALLCQLLIYPAVDAEMSSASFEENADGPFLTRADMAWFYEHYLGPPSTDRRDWRLSPLHADDLSELPPALVVTASLDPLRDEGEGYAQALAAAGGRASAVRYPGATHGFFGWAHLAEPSRQVMAQASGWLRSELGR